jgi:hypothetical protein
MKSFYFLLVNPLNSGNLFVLQIAQKNPSGQWALVTTLQLVMSTSIHH